MRAFLSLLLVLNVAVFAKRFGGSEVGNRAGVEVVNGREVQVFGEDVTEEMGVEDLDKGVVVGDAWMKKLKVKRMKGNLSAPTLPSAWKGRFELGKLLGEGGFGQVYKMKVTCDDKSSSFVSAKFLKRSASDLVKKFAENMEDQHKELQRMQARWSEYVVSTVGSPDAVDDDKPLFPGNPVVGDVMDGQWVMMPLYNAGSFKDLLKSCSNEEKCTRLHKTPNYDYWGYQQGWKENRKEANWKAVPGFKDINRKTVLALFDNALAGLEAIHKQGLVHMDLKPDNIMLNCKGEDVNRSMHDCYGIVIDLGTLCNKTICSTTSITSTRGYFSPEVLSFEPEKMYIPSNDVWSMGVVLFSLLYLDTPTYMDGYTRDKLFNYKVREDPGVPLPEHRSEIDELVIDMLETDYKKRVTLPEVRRRLRLYLHRQSVWSSFSVATDLTKMLDTTPSERGVAGDLPSCINGGA